MIDIGSMPNLNIDPEALAALGEAMVRSKYTPNQKNHELIGLKDAILLWGTLIGKDNSTDDAGNSGLHLSIFDTTSRDDSAQIQLLNDSGDAQWVTGAVIRAKPIERLSNDLGYIADNHIDYEDIYRNGEKKFELGNNYIVTKAQTEQLEDFHWKNFRQKRHIYAVIMTGTRYWFSPGQWYTLQIGSEGETEYIDSVCECISVQTERGSGELGTTVVMFREVIQNWKKDSNSLARFIAQGDPKGIYNFGRVIVAASDYLGTADYYCDDTSDEDEINAAITELGGGVIELTEGHYYIDGSIDPTSDISIIGKGSKTIIEKNCDDYAIDITGTTETYKENIILRDFKVTRNSSDTNDKALIHLKYARNVILENITIDNAYTDGILIENCENVKLHKCIIKDAGGNGVILKQTVQAALLASVITGCGGIGCKAITDDATDLIDRGNCESTTVPALTGEISNSPLNCTFARSNDYAYGGTYSYKITSSNLPYWLFLTDNTDGSDLHGITPGKTYCVKTQFYIPSANFNSSRLKIRTGYCRTGIGWRYNEMAFENGTDNPLKYDQWSLLEFAISIPINACGFMFGHIPKSDGNVGDYFYVDNIELLEANYENNGYIIDNITIKNNKGEGLYIATNQTKITNNIIENNKGIGIKIAGGEDNYLKDNIARDNGNLLNYADCENSSQPPAIKDDGASTNNASFARSGDQKYEGTYSYKHTITATGTDGDARFCDDAATDDLHELVAGQTYELEGYVYVPSTGGPAAAETKIVLGYYDSAAWTLTEVAATGQDAWEKVTTGDVAIPSTATAAIALVRIDSSASDDEFVYWDNLRLIPKGIHNEHSQNFSDAGTETQFGQNSWQGVQV